MRLTSAGRNPDASSTYFLRSSWTTRTTPNSPDFNKEECIIDYQQIPTTFEARFDGRDTQEIRHREKADQAIIPLFDGVIFCYHKSRTQQRKQSDLDSELLLEARKSASLAKERIAERSGASNSGI